MKSTVIVATTPLTSLLSAPNALLGDALAASWAFATRW